MLGIDRRTLQAAWTLFLFAMVLFVIYEIRRTVMLLALALILAHLLSPAVGFAERILPRRAPRVAALALVYLAFIAVITIAMIPLGSRLSREAVALASRLPDVLASDPLSRIPLPSAFEGMRPGLNNFVQDRLAELGEAVGPMLSAAGSHILTGLGAVAGAVLIPIIAFFLLKDGAGIRDAIVESFEGERREVVQDILGDIHHLLAEYIRSLVLLALAAFAFYGVFLASTGAPYPVLLAGFAATLEFIPAVGPFVGAATILLVTGVAGYTHLLALFIFLVLYRIFQDYVLSPYLMSAGVKIHPLMVLFGVLAGEQLAGVPGMFFSVPVMAALRLILVRLRRRRLGST
jgi:predicted PurR-regulated permease PerM